ncbi:MAG: GAF domain-containing sensor histidine kinase [Gemmatimonadales bacterium]
MTDSPETPPDSSSSSEPRPTWSASSAGHGAQRVADLAREVLGAQYAAISLLDADRQTLASFTTSGLTDQQRERIGAPPTGHGVLGLVIRERVGAPARRPDPPSGFSRDAGQPSGDALVPGVPVIGRDGILGNLYLTEKIGAKDFSDADVQIAILLASIVATAVRTPSTTSRSPTCSTRPSSCTAPAAVLAMVSYTSSECPGRDLRVGGDAGPEERPRHRAARSVRDPRGAEQAVSLVNDLLDLRRLDEDQLKPLLQMVDCCRVVRNAVRTVTPLASDKRVVIAVPEDRAVPCYTDAHRVEQIFVNLLTNAIRHTPESSRITIDAEMEDEHVSFTVRDQGPGIPPGEEERIFDIYFTTADRGDGRGRGHGVGLPLSRRLARLMGGDLRALPASEAGGGALVVRLPRSESMN